MGPGCVKTHSSAIVTQFSIPERSVLEIKIHEKAFNFSDIPFFSFVSEFSHSLGHEEPFPFSSRRVCYPFRRWSMAGKDYAGTGFSIRFSGASAGSTPYRSYSALTRPGHRYAVVLVQLQTEASKYLPDQPIVVGWSVSTVRSSEGGQRQAGPAGNRTSVVEKARR
jgi:hypothetical protein